MRESCMASIKDMVHRCDACGMPNSRPSLPTCRMSSSHKLTRRSRVVGTHSTCIYNYIHVDAQFVAAD